MQGMSLDVVPAAPLQLGSSRTLGAGAMGTVESGEFVGSDGRARSVIAKLSNVKVRRGENLAEKQEDARQAARLELLGGMMGCSQVAPCLPGTPVMAYEGGAVSAGNAAAVVAIFVQPMSGVGVEKLLDFGGDAGAQATVRQQWENFASTVSPWLSSAAAASDGAAKVTTTLRRDLDAALVGVQQTLFGLAHLWDRGIVHRDVKPDNIMINDGVFTLVDLGFACVYKTAWSPQELSHLPPALRTYVQNKKCLNRVPPGGRKTLQCLTDETKTDFSGTLPYLSPALVYSDARKSIIANAGQIDEGARQPSMPPAFCIFNRRACELSAQQDTAVGVDAFSAGIMLLEFLTGARAFDMQEAGASFLGVPHSVNSAMIGAFIRLARVARYLALDDVSPSGADAEPADAPRLRARVRGRARALLEAALAAGDSVRERKETAGQHNAFTLPLAEAVGIKPSLRMGASELSANCYSVYRALNNLVQPISLCAMQFCQKAEGSTQPDCGHTPEAERDDERVASETSGPPAPGTAALLELLANLLSPSKTPGLARDKTTLLELARSVDDVRAALLQQWGLPDRDLAAHLKAVADCIRSPATAAASLTRAEASAHCRYVDLKRSGPGEPADMRYYADALLGGSAAASSNPMLLSVSSIADAAQWSGPLGGSDPQNIRSSTADLHRAVIGGEGENIVARTLATRLRLAIKPDAQAAVVAVAERARKSDHKPLFLHAWGSGVQTRHIAITESNRRLFLSYYDPTVVPAPGGFVPPKVEEELELVRDGGGFGSAAGGIKMRLRSQATLCTIFLEDNKQNAELVKRVRGQAAGARASFPTLLPAHGPLRAPPPPSPTHTHTLATQVNNACGKGAGIRDPTCYCFALRSGTSDYVMRIVFSTTPDQTAAQTFAAAIAGAFARTEPATAARP